MRTHFGTNLIGRVLEEVAVLILLFVEKEKMEKKSFLFWWNRFVISFNCYKEPSIEIYGFKRQCVFEFINSNGSSLKGFNWIELNNWPSNIKYWWCLSHFFLYIEVSNRFVFEFINSKWINFNWIAYQIIHIGDFFRIVILFKLTFGLFNRILESRYNNLHFGNHKLEFKRHLDFISNHFSPRKQIVRRGGGGGGFEASNSFAS